MPSTTSAFISPTETFRLTEGAFPDRNGGINAGRGVITPTVTTVKRYGRTVTLVPWNFTLLPDGSMSYVDPDGVVHSSIPLPGIDVPGVTAGTGLQYRAQRWYSQNGVPVLLDDFLFNAPAGGSGSLSSLAPVDEVDGVPIIQGEAGRGIVSTANVDGRLVVTYTDGTVDDVGPLPVSGGGGEVVRGIEDVDIINGELIVTFTDGTSENLGPVVGQDGDDGRSVAYVGITAGNLIVGYSDESVANLGNVVGRGIISTSVVGGDLIVTYSDNTSENAGTVVTSGGGDGGGSAAAQDTGWWKFTKDSTTKMYLNRTAGFTNIWFDVTGLDRSGVTIDINFLPATFMNGFSIPGPESLGIFTVPGSKSNGIGCSMHVEITATQHPYFFINLLNNMTGTPSGSPDNFKGMISYMTLEPFPETINLPGWVKVTSPSMW